MDVESREGFPKGGIMRNVLFDEFLKLYSEGLVSCEGFADDPLLMVSGHSLQMALDRAV